MNGRPLQLSPVRLLAGVVLPLAAYLLIRAATGSATGALAITEAVPASSPTGPRRGSSSSAPA